MPSRIVRTAATAFLRAMGATAMACAVAALWGAGTPAMAADIFIMTSNTDHAYIAKHLGGELVEVYTPHKGYQEPELTWVDEILPSWVIKARRADLYIRYGLYADIWADTVIEASRNHDIFFGAPGYLDPAEGIAVLDVPSGPVDRRLGEVHLFGNPHFLLDPANAAHVARATAKRMTLLWPEHQGVFQGNLDDFLATLERKMKEWEQKAAPLRGKNIATYHRTWSYFTDRYGLNVVGVCEPKPNIEPTPADLRALIFAMKSTPTPVLIKTPVYSDKWPNYVREQLDYPVSIHTLGAHVGGDDGVETYFDLFDYLIDNLLRAYGEN